MTMSLLVYEFFPAYDNYEDSCYNIHMQVLCGNMFLFILAKYRVVELLCHMVSTYLTL